MNCTSHVDREATGICSYCGKPFCQECLVEVDGKMVCKQDITRMYQDAKNTQSQQTPIHINIDNSGNKQDRSYFDGGLGSYIGTVIAGTLITLITIGICFPWALCMMYRWKIQHTVIDGRRLKFNGSAVGLFGNWIKWWFLCLITFGIYSFWLVIALERWRVKHTTFEN